MASVLVSKRLANGPVHEHRRDAAFVRSHVPYVHNARHQFVPLCYAILLTVFGRYIMLYLEKNTSKLTLLSMAIDIL